MSGPQLDVPPGKKLGVKITPLAGVSYLPGRVCGAPAAECGLQSTNSNAWYLGASELDATRMSQEDLVKLEASMRDAALSTSSVLLVGLNATPAADLGGGQMLPLVPPRAAFGSGTGMDMLAGAAHSGIYQLMTFPISRLNGVALPADSRIRFADPSRWLQGAMESRLFTVSVDGTKKYYSWDAHAPAGNTPHDFYHVNQKGMYNVFGHSDHAPLTGTALVQAKQLRYLKMGGRVFLVVGVVVDGIQMAGAVQQSFEQKSVKPAAAQAVRTGGSWLAAWGGAKAGMAAGALAGVETGPGLVLTAIGGGIVGGVAGYLGADWIADWIYED